MTDTRIEAAGPVPDYPMPRASGFPLDPPPGLRALQEVGPIARVQLWDGNTPWAVTRYAEEWELLSDPRLSSDFAQPNYPHSGAGLTARYAEKGQSFLTMDDPEHHQQRQMMTMAFTVKRMEGLRPTIQKIVDGLIDDMLAGPKPADLVTALALPVTSTVISALLGVPYADHEFFQVNSAIILNRDSSPEDTLVAQERLVSYLDKLIVDKVASPADDLLSELAEPIKSGKLSRLDAAMMGMLMLAAGHETTANMISLGTVALLQNPDQLSILRQTSDPKVIAGAVEELLRYLNVGNYGLRRTALEDIQVGDQVMRAGDGVLLTHNIANRDPAAFPDPDRLDITRDARHHLAFGYGVHQCMGQNLARTELQIVYGTLYRRIPTLHLAVDLDQISFKHDALAYGVYELPVAW
jgi:cytochrome P450